MTPCRLCNSKDSARIFQKDNYDILRCNACSLKYTNSSLGPEQLKSLYCENYFKSKGTSTSYYDYMSEASAMEANAARRLAAIERIKPAGKDSRLLDVGCATGFFLKIASRKWEAHGVELSEFASSYVRDELKLHVRTGTVKDASYPDGYFDVVTMWDVVEHLQDPVVDLKEICRITKEGGLLVLTTGDSDSIFAALCGRFWHLYNPVQHFSFFSRKTIELLLARAGFRVIKIKRSGNIFTIGYLVSMASVYHPYRILKGIQSIVDSSPFKGIKVHINLGDIMTVYAVRAG